MRISISTIPVILLSCLSVLCVPIWASRGDQLAEFKECVRFCIEQNCIYDPTPLPLHLRLLLWTCPTECDYSCQRTVTQLRLESVPQKPIEQFHGKWPFRRVLGIQEPFSVIFSLANLYAHVYGLESLKREVPRSYPLYGYYRLFGYMGLVCWFWSAVFHTRDFRFTERMDYFAAGANVMYGLFLAPVKVWKWYLPSSTSSAPSAFREKATISGATSTPTPLRLHLWALVCFSLYAAHVYYLTCVRWSYTYNMAANVVIGALTNLIWSYFAIRHYSRLKQLWAATPGLIVTWLVLAMSLELLDFPPLWGAIDAHSLWHAATVAPTVMWYGFLIRDAKREVEGDEGVRRVD
ncbi:Per1-like protein [Terfezia boudieri ATCC MYA-4762]|uniref:Post-GPI attachment to proteins factor 3 n=1 Tax=Terfezia boudieri ATCC MYA-4762 TaxID=1051890 RepID=A0A3N4LGY0_9PEZI|nr:Per1-like protein [Terfezia boudieri ATCC MYA-4762]